MSNLSETAGASSLVLGVGRNYKIACVDKCEVGFGPYHERFKKQLEFVARGRRMGS